MPEIPDFDQIYRDGVDQREQATASAQPTIWQRWNAECESVGESLQGAPLETYLDTEQASTLNVFLDVMDTYGHPRAMTYKLERQKYARGTSRIYTSNRGKRTGYSIGELVFNNQRIEVIGCVDRTLRRNSIGFGRWENWRGTQISYNGIGALPVLEEASFEPGFYTAGEYEHGHGTPSIFNHCSLTDILTRLAQ